MRPFASARGIAALAVIATAAAPLAAQTAATSGATTPASRPAAPRARTTGALPAPVRVTSVEGITEYALGNGLRVLLFPDASKPTTTVNITYLVGSRHEGYGETGMAHLLEHLMFKGSTGHRNVPQELTQHGSRPNGTTWLDRTNYFETVPATDSNVDWALDLEADRMVNSFIAKKDLDSEFSVVRNEFEMGENSPFSILLERTLSTAFLWHNYGHSTIGARSDIENVPIERLQAFYRRYYQPDNAILVVAGKFDEAPTLRKINEKYGRIPRPVRSLSNANLLYPTYTAEPTQDGERAVTLRRSGDVQVVMAAYHVPALAHPDFAAVDVLANALGDEPSGRLYKALVEPKKAASTGAFTFELREPGVLVGFAQVRQEQSLDSARAIFERAIDQVVATPMSAAEVDRAKTDILKNFDLLLNSSERVGFALTEYAASGDWRLLFLERDRVKAVTPADVQRVAAAYLKPTNRTVGLFVPTSKPDRAEIPQAGDVVAMVKDYKGQAQVARGEAFDPSPANVDARTTRSALPNGMHLSLLPKKTRGGTVNARLFLRFGTEQSLQNRAAAGALTAAMLDRGTAKLTRQQVKDSLDKLKARVGISGSATSATASIETTRDNFPAVLALVAEELRHPALDPTEFDRLKQEQLASIEESKSEPTALGSIEYSRRMEPYPASHPNYTPTFAEQAARVAATTLAEVKQFHSAFYGASGGDLVVVGDVDAPAVTKLATTLFGDWKAPEAYARIERRFHATDSTAVSIPTPDKANAFFLAGSSVNIRDDDPDYPAMALANFMLGGGFLNSRLATRIRQKEGISYGVGSQFQASSLDRTATLSTYAIYAPQNVERLVAAYRDEMRRALKDGFTAEEIAAAKPGYLQQRLQQRANDPELATVLVARRFAGRTMAYDADLEKKVAALTPAEVNAAIRKYVDPNKVVMVTAGDFTKKPAPAATP